MEVNVQTGVNMSTDTTDHCNPNIAIMENVEETTFPIQSLVKLESPKEDGDIMGFPIKEEQKPETGTYFQDKDMERTTLIGTTNGYSWFVIPKEKPDVDCCKSSTSVKTTLEDISMQSPDVKGSDEISDTLPLQKTTRNTEKVCTCKQCGCVFACASDLATHCKTHALDNSDRNSQERDLTQSSHQGTHLGTNAAKKHEKPFKCNACDKAFSYSSHLVIHMRTHSGEKPFKCETCELSFRQPSHLVSHIRTHSGEKPFKCDTCKHSFSMSSHLVEHMRTHTGERPFTCGTCKRSFRLSNGLVRHMRAHTGEKPFKCDVCKRAFSRRSYVARHMRTHKGE